MNLITTIGPSANQETSKQRNQVAVTTSQEPFTMKKKVITLEVCDGNNSIESDHQTNIFIKSDTKPVTQDKFEKKFTH